MSRTNKTAVNSAVGLICSVISSLMSLVLRALFIRLLGLEYAGVNSLFTDILSILNLADLGFNNAILYRIYKSLAEKNDEDTEMYLTLYRKICYVVGTIIAVAGLFCIPFLPYLVKRVPSFSEPMWSLYIIILATSVLSHILNYKSILIIAKQDRFITTVIQYTCIFARNGLQILVLLVHKNIYLYLLVSLLTVLIQGIWTGIVSNKRYRLSWHSQKKVPGSELAGIKKDVGALAIYKLCRTLDATVDTFLISRFVDVATTAIYGSISMILSALYELLGVCNDGMIASVGDLNASGNKERLNEVFYESFHFTFFIYGACAVALMPFISSFMVWWIGYALDESCHYIMLVNFVMYGFGMNVATFRNSMGIFRKGWLRPAFTAAFNLFFSVLLINRLGLMGTLLGTLIARVLTLVWYDPWLVLRHGMHKSPWKYYARYAYYLVAILLTGWMLTQLSGFLPEMDCLPKLLMDGCIFFVFGGLCLLALGSVFPDNRTVLRRINSIMKNAVRKIKGAVM